MMETESLRLTQFQQRVVSIPEGLDAFLGGGRGGGKSYTLALLALRHVAQYGERARILYLRRTYKGLADFELICRELFGLVYGADARYNATEHTWRFPGGGYMELGQLETEADYAKYQGRSFTLLLVDEAGQYPTPDLLDRMRSNLRGPKDMPLRTVLAANPGGPGHHWLARRFVFKAAPWMPFVDEKSKREFVSAPSTYSDNDLIDRELYLSQLEASCSSDPELLRAWANGDWAISRGAYFAAVLEESRVAVGPFEVGKLPKTWGREWPVWLAHDFGSAAPSVTYLMTQSAGAEFAGKFYPRDSVIALDEYAVHVPGDYSKGLGWTAATTAEALREFCAAWKVSPSGVADDAIFSNTGNARTIAEEFSAKGVSFYPARKADRISGWMRMSRMLADAGKPDVPGLYVSRACEYFWATVPHLARDQKRIEDVDSRGPDHGADACRYGLLRQNFATAINIGIAN